MTILEIYLVKNSYWALGIKMIHICIIKSKYTIKSMCQKYKVHTKVLMYIQNTIATYQS